MRNKIILKGVPELFFGILLLLFLSTSLAFSQGVGDSLNFDNYTGELSSLNPNSLAMQYTSVDRPGMIDGQESGSFQYRGSQKSKDESVYIEIRIERTTPRKTRPEATKDIQYRAFQGFIISYDSIIQGKGDMGGRTVTRNTLDKDEIPNLMKDSHAEGMAKMMGNYHLFEAQKVAGSIVHRQILVHAGNIFIHASYAQYDKIQNRPPDLALLVNEILAKLPKKELEKNVLVYPYGGLSPSNTGILPASSLLPAKIVYKAGKSKLPVSFTLEQSAQGILKQDKKSGKTIKTTTNSEGMAEVFFYYVPVDTKPLNAALSYRITISSLLETQQAIVKVGLRLAFKKIMAVPGQAYKYSPDTPYAFTLSVKSMFHPNLNLPVYLDNADTSMVWGDKKLGLKLFTNWENRSPDKPDDIPYRGTANVTASYKGTNENVLTANNEPWYTPANYFYPAVILKSTGEHIYRIAGETVVLDKTSKRILQEPRNEGMEANTTFLVLSTDEPEKLYQSLACSLNATTKVQYVMLEAIKMIPSYGTAVDYVTTATSLVCGMLKEEYEKSFLDIATWLGGKYLDRLGEAEVFEKLTDKQQVALKAAKVNYDVLDKVKKKRELGELKNVWTPPLDGEEGADQGQQKQASPVVAPAQQQTPPPVASPLPPPQQQPAGQQQQPPTQTIEKTLDLFKKARDIFGR